MERGTNGVAVSMIPQRESARAASPPPYHPPGDLPHPFVLVLVRQLPQLSQRAMIKELGAAGVRSLARIRAASSRIPLTPATCRPDRAPAAATTCRRAVRCLTR